MTPGHNSYPPPPGNVAPYVDILGVDGAIEFLLAFGGAELYHAEAPKGGSKVAQVVGLSKAKRLASISAALKSRVPIPRQWIAQVLFAKGLSIAEIARTLHITDVTVKKHLDGKKRPPGDPRQPQLI